jgi:hypothetical protein
MAACAAPPPPPLGGSGGGWLPAAAAVARPRMYHAMVWGTWPGSGEKFQLLTGLISHGEAAAAEQQQQQGHMLVLISAVG